MGHERGGSGKHRWAAAWGWPEPGLLRPGKPAAAECHARLTALELQAGRLLCTGFSVPVSQHMPQQLRLACGQHSIPALATLCCVSTCPQQWQRPAAQPALDSCACHALRAAFCTCHPFRAADMEFIVLLDGVDESTSRALEVRCSAADHASLGKLAAHVSMVQPPLAPAGLVGPTETPVAPCPACRPARPRPLNLQARHSYLPSDIRWHHHFEPCIQRRWSPQHVPLRCIAERHSLAARNAE